MTWKKKVYVCQMCNSYLTKDEDEPVPICCGKEVFEMDEVVEKDIYKQKETSGGL